MEKIKENKSYPQNKGKSCGNVAVFLWIYSGLSVDSAWKTFVLTDESVIGILKSI